jgi:hypothetical protein
MFQKKFKFSELFFVEIVRKISVKAHKVDAQTSSLLADPEFMKKLNRLKADPSALADAINNPRMLAVMSVALGIYIRTSDGPPTEPIDFVWTFASLIQRYLLAASNSQKSEHVRQQWRIQTPCIRIAVNIDQPRPLRAKT